MIGRQRIERLAHHLAALYSALGLVKPTYQQQAIGSIASELEEQGYLCRETDIVDGRQVSLGLTVAGAKPIEDSVAAIVELEEEFSHRIRRLAATIGCRGGARTRRHTD